MTCYRIGGDHPGFICLNDRPLIIVKHGGRTYRFERSSACGLLAVNANGNQRLSPVPGAVWDMASEIQNSPNTTRDALTGEESTDA